MQAVFGGKTATKTTYVCVDCAHIHSPTATGQPVVHCIAALGAKPARKAMLKTLSQHFTCDREDTICVCRLTVFLVPRLTRWVDIR